MAQTEQSPVETIIRRTGVETPWTYAELDGLQKRVAARACEGGPGALILSELEPVITTGRRTPESDLPWPRAEYERRGIEVLPVDRGGLATYHGPGQWVLFAVDTLERLTGDRKGVRTAVQGLLETAERAASEWVSEAEIRDGCELGVWSPKGKFSAVGVHVSGGVLMHGLALNAYRTPTSFLGMRPCGLDAPVHYILDGAGDGEREAAFERLGRRLVEAAQDVFYS